MGSGSFAMKATSLAGASVCRAAPDCVCGGQRNSRGRASDPRAYRAPGCAAWSWSPARRRTHAELRAAIGDRLDARLINGTERRTGRNAKADLAWADLVIVWGGTELGHKVSKLCTDGNDDHVVTCPRRGIAGLATTMVEAARRR